jgi:acyl transferase domain-containing protein
VNNTTKKTIEENINGDYMKEENINNKVEIEAYEVEDEGEEDEVQHNKYFLVTISAKNEASLIQLTKEYINELEELEEDKNHWKRKLTNFCYSSNICRKHFNTRIAAVGENVSD